MFSKKKALVSTTELDTAVPATSPSTYSVTTSDLPVALKAPPTKRGGLGVSRVFRICNSYESGYGHGVSGDGLDSTKTIISDLEAAEAYQIGYEAGVNAVKRN